jgi:hypothetical protein
MESSDKWDYSLYPDIEAPDMERATEYDKADYLHRFCTQADFGVFPFLSQIQALSGWRDIFDKYPVVNSTMYRVLRELFGWPAVKNNWPSMDKLSWQIKDEEEGRPLSITM